MVKGPLAECYIYIYICFFVVLIVLYLFRSFFLRKPPCNGALAAPRAYPTQKCPMPRINSGDHTTQAQRAVNPSESKGRKIQSTSPKGN